MFLQDRGRKNLNTQERASIITFLECEKTVTWISAKMGVSLSTVSHWKRDTKKLEMSQEKMDQIQKNYARK